MEEKHAGQDPEAEVSNSDSSRINSVATPGDKPENLAILNEAKARARQDRAVMREKGFGDHKGEEGF